MQATDAAPNLSTFQATDDSAPTFQAPDYSTVGTTTLKATEDSEVLGSKAPNFSAPKESPFATFSVANLATFGGRN